MKEGGIVRDWRADEGWGVVECAGAPGGCWVHFSAVVMAGYRELSAGQVVTVEHEPADQDGYRYRAVWVWPQGTPDEVPEGPAALERSSAYRSRLTLWFELTLPPALAGDGGSGGGASDGLPEGGDVRRFPAAEGRVRLAAPVVHRGVVDHRADRYATPAAHGVMPGGAVVVGGGVVVGGVVVGGVVVGGVVGVQPKTLNSHSE